MTEPKFTPGPWHVESELNVQGQKYYSVSFGDDDGLICEFIAFKEDAHLIAAAPEMYAELNYIYFNGFHGQFERIESILRKALGESEVSE